MSEFRHILVATDGSPSAQRAFARALELAGTLRTRLTILAVVEAGRGRTGVASDVEAMQHELEGRLKEFCEIACAAGIRRVKPMTESGIPYSRILKMAEEEDVDLLVLGGNGWNSQAPDLGGVAGHVVKFATCPVLIVR